MYAFLGYNNLNGTLDFGDGHINSTDTALMLDNIEYLDVSNNKLSGTIINLENIAENIEYLRINNNNLIAEINDILNVFSNSDIIDLSISNNKITGSINWDIFRNETDSGTSSFEYLESLYIYSNQLRYLYSLFLLFTQSQFYTTY